jgi:signal transduction histidine kinase
VHAGAGPLDEQTHTDLLRQALRQQREKVLDLVVRDSAIALGFAGVVAAGLGWVLAGRVLAPVRRITETAGRVAERTLHERVNLVGRRDELGELAETVDAMLGRLDRAFDGQRRFVADASHELRTPMAVSRTVLEAELAGEIDDPRVRQTYATLLSMNERGERTLDGLLMLARVEGRPLERDPLDLSDPAALALEQSAAAASAAGVEIRAELDEAATTGDRLLLERVALNLVQNAIKYNEPGGWVEARTGVEGDRAYLEVTNTGVTVAERSIDAIFEPFRRLDGTNSRGGAGLGLSIVRAVARRHGGEAAAQPRPGGGLVLRVTLPAH